MSYRLLIIDDETDFTATLQALFMDEGYECLTAATGTIGLELALTQQVDLVITDLKMPELDGLQVLQELRKEHTDLPVILLTAHASVDTAVQALKFGAVDYLPKPIDFDILERRVRESLRALDVHRELRILKQQCQSGTCAECTPAIGESVTWKRVLRQVDQAAQSDAPVLILGESGTGKEVAAKLVHRLGPRVAEPFVAVNAGAIPDELVEAELFGVRRGAFTGADRDRDGLLRTAGKGTLFLDEVAELPHTDQVKLLRVLDGEEARPVGSDRGYQPECRFVAATNRDLKELVADGAFREDLYYRLAVFEIVIPPLRDRRDDIPHLTAHFLRCYAKRLVQPMRQLAPEALNALTAAPWPGNVRQLENVIRRTLMVTGKDRIRTQDLPRGFAGDAPEPSRASLKDAMRFFEKNYLSQTLAEHDGDKKATAKSLGISLASLYDKLRKLDIS